MTNASNGKRDFFVSFNQADRAMATWVAWVLEENGYSVFFQDWDFRGNFVEHMNRAHAQAHRTLAVLSENYFGSDFTLAEWSARFAQDPAAREDRLVPVKVGLLTGETILGPIVYADLTGCEEAEAQQRLLGRVKKAVDASYRDKPKSRPGFPDSPPRQVPEKPSFPPAGGSSSTAGQEEDAATASLRGGTTIQANRGAIAGGGNVSVRTSHGLSGLQITLLVLVVVGGVLLASGLLGNRITATNSAGTGGDITGSTVTVNGGSGTTKP